MKIPPPQLQRLADGRVNWQAAPREYITAQLRKGRTLAQIATQLGTTATAIGQANTTHGFARLPEGEMTLSAVAREIGVSELTVSHRCKELGITLRSWGVRRTLTTPQFDRLLPSFAEGYTMDDITSQGWVSAKEACARLGITYRMFLSRVEAHGVRRVKVQGVQGSCYRYHPLDVGRLQVPISPIGKPRGYCDPSEMSAILGVCLSTLTSWRERGCPCVPNRVGHREHFFNPAAVQKWLEELRPGSHRGIVSRRRALTRLKGYFRRQMQAAA